MRRALLFVFLLSAPGLFASSAHAFTGHPTGPSTVAINSVLASPWTDGEWYAGSANTVYRYSPATDAWTSSGDGLPFGQVTSLVGGPNMFGLLYCAVPAQGACRSTDYGGSWIGINNGLDNLNVSALALDPSHPHNVFAATGAGVYKSTNSGDTWIAGGLAGKPVLDIAFGSSGTTYAWASVSGEGIYRTSDHGATWNIASNGMTGEKIFHDVKVQLYGHIYAVGRGCFRSTNGGDSWTAFGAEYGSPYTEVWEIAGRPNDPHQVAVATLGSGVWRSTDGGVTWAPIPPPCTGHEYLAIASRFFDTGEVLVGGYGGEIFRSDAFGDAWHWCNRGISTAIVFSMAAHGERWLAGTERGIYVSENSGFDWETSDLVFDVGAEAFTVVFAPGDGMTAWCGTASLDAGEIYKSVDGGHHWTPVRATAGSMKALAVDPVDPSRVYAGYTCNLVRTTDGGSSWIVQSLDGVCVNALQVIEATPSIILAGTNNGIWRSTNYGDTWEQVGLTGTLVLDISADASVASRFFAATIGSRVHVTNDFGVTWSPFGGNDLPVNVYSVDGMTPAAGVLAGTEANGIWRYTGSDWAQLPTEEQPNASGILCFVGGIDGGRFLAGTYGAGVWDYIVNPSLVEDLGGKRLPLKLAVTGSPGSGPFRMELAGGTVASGRAATRSETAGATAGRVEILDALGRTVRVIDTAGPGAPGAASSTWDGRDTHGDDVPAGIYFVRARVVAGGAVAGAKITVVR